MPEIQKYSLKEELSKKDEQITDDPSLYGMSALTFPRYINSMRSVMFCSHLKQFLTPLNPDFPFVFTNVENIVGEGSAGYKKVDNRCKVYKKIVKFEDILDHPTRYSLFIYDEVKNKYDVIDRKELEDLTENFGFNYINDVIDGFEEGDVIDPDTVLSKSTSYDDDMNYRYGKNVTVMYTLDPYTSEDAAEMSESLAKHFQTIETETIAIKLNSNDFLLNLYGKHGEYKPLPDIGDFATGVLGSIRTQFNNQVLFDFKSESLNKIHPGDRTIYVNGTVEIVDVTIFSNNEEIVDTPFNSFINRYLRSQNRYYREINKTCKEIMESGSEYSREIDYLYKRSEEMIDTKKKWKEGDSAFSNMIIEVTTRKVKNAQKGQKFSGRYGNKSVISRVLPDDEMPFTESGKRVDLLLNLLAIINRTTSFSIYELMITSITAKAREYMKTLKTFKQKEKFLFTLIGDFNERQRVEMLKTYEALSTEKKKEVINDAIDNGIYINQSPIHEDTAIFYRIRNIMEKYSDTWLKPDTVYVNKWGRKIKTLSKHWIGEMYIIKLKQSDLRGFSARSTGAIDIKGLPTRSYKSKNHMERHSDSAIRFGEFETLNFFVGLPSEDIALLHSIYRTSIKGREDIVKSLFSMEGDENGAITKIDNSYTSRAAEIFNVFFKALSLEVEFLDDDNVLKGYDNSNVRVRTVNGHTIFCTDYEYFLIERIMEVREEILGETLILSNDQLKEEIIHRLNTRKYINGSEFSEEGSKILTEVLNDPEF